MIFYVWRVEELIEGCQSYAKHYITVKDINEGNASHFKLNDSLHIALNKFAENGPLETVWSALENIS